MVREEGIVRRCFVCSELTNNDNQEVFCLFCLINKHFEQLRVFCEGVETEESARENSNSFLVEILKFEHEHGEISTAIEYTKEALLEIKKKKEREFAGINEKIKEKKEENLQASLQLDELEDLKKDLEQEISDLKKEVLDNKNKNSSLTEEHQKIINIIETLEKKKNDLSNLEIEKKKRLGELEEGFREKKQLFLILKQKTTDLANKLKKTIVEIEKQIGKEQQEKKPNEKVRVVDLFTKNSLSSSSSPCLFSTQLASTTPFYQIDEEDVSTIIKKGEAILDDLNQKVKRFINLNKELVKENKELEEQKNLKQDEIQKLSSSSIEEYHGKKFEQIKHLRDDISYAKIELERITDKKEKERERVELLLDKAKKIQISIKTESARFIEKNNTKKEKTKINFQTRKTNTERQKEIVNQHFFEILAFSVPLTSLILMFFLVIFKQKEW